MQVAAGGGPRHLDPSQRLAAPGARERVDVLRVDRAEPVRELAEQVVGDALVVRPVLAVVPVWHGERDGLVGLDLAGEGLLPPLDVRAHALLPALEVLALVLVGVVRAEVVLAGGVPDLLVAHARVELQVPAAAALHRVQLVPGQVLGVAVLDAADVHEHDCVEAELLEDAVGARPRVGPGVVEGQEERPRGSSTACPWTKRTKVSRSIVW